jgi:hypothetical protein
MAADDALNGEQFAPKIPRYAMFGGRGRVRVLNYEGNNRFTVLAKDDSKVLVHRDNLTFVKDPKRRP